jgi:hypothetical protein
VGNRNLAITSLKINELYNHTLENMGAYYLPSLFKKNNRNFPLERVGRLRM